MTFPITARQYYAKRPPRAPQLSVPGSVAPITVSGSASYINLQSFLAQTQSDGTAYGTQTKGVLGQRVSITAITATIGIITGKVVGDVTGSNAPNLSNVCTVSNGVVTMVAGACMQIPPGTTLEFIPNASQDVFLGFVGSGAGTMILYQTSDTNS